MSRDDYFMAEDAITVHEAKHIANRHWIDLLISEITLILNWFSPAAWLLKDELRTVHEYQADMAVLKSGADARSYQMLLIKKAVGSRFPSLANSLNHSKLKKRITMMLKSSSSKRCTWRALALAPALAGVLVVFNQPAIASVISTVATGSLSAILLSDPKDTESASTIQEAMTDNNVPTSSKTDDLVIVGYTKDRPEDMNITFMVNGKKASWVEVKNIDPELIEKIEMDKSGSTPVARISVDYTKKKAAMKVSDQGSRTVSTSTTAHTESGETQLAGNVVAVRSASDSGAITIVGNSRLETVNGNAANKPAIFVNNIRIKNDDLTGIDSNSIKSITVHKDMQEYPDGAIFITLKSDD